MFAPFTPPTLAQRLAALGPLAGLPETLQRALQPGNDFEPMPVPGPNDWLANFPEAGQTFQQFVQSEPNRPDAQPLHLCPVDLRKLQWSIGFDVVERYRRLRHFHRQAGFEDEAQWLDERLKHLTPHD
jgi:hypothetical protein